MKVVKHGDFRQLERENTPCTCSFCRCEFVFRPCEARRVEDQLDGDYYRVACPECSVLNSVDIRLTGSAVPQPASRNDG